MEITSVSVRVTDDPNSRMKAMVSVLVDGCFAIHDIRVINGNNGLFVAMPSRKKQSGEYHDIAHPTNSECRKMFEEAILKEYEKELEQSK